MKKISKSEYDKLIFKQSSPIINACKKLKVGEMVMVDYSDYPFKSHLSQYIGASQDQPSGLLYKAKIRVSIKTLIDYHGWVLTRIK